MHSASLDDSRQITSSRQSPRMSALRLGVALVPLFDETPDGASKAVVLPASQFHLEIVVTSSNSRSRSPSHQTPKLIDGFADEIWTPRGPRTEFGVDSCAVYMPPVGPDPHIS